MSSFSEMNGNNWSTLSQTATSYNPSNPTFGDNCVVTFNTNNYFCHQCRNCTRNPQLRGMIYPQHSWVMDESARDEWHRHNPTMRDPQFSSRRSDSSDAFRSHSPLANTWGSNATSPTLTRSHLADVRTEEKTMLDSQSAAGCSVATSKVRTKAEGKEIGCGKPLSTARDLAASNPKLVSPSTRRPMVGSCAHSSERLTGRKRASERQLVNRRSIAEALLRALFTQRLSGWKAEDCSQAYAFCVAFAPVLVAGVSSEQFSEACRRVASSMQPEGHSMHAATASPPLETRSGDLQQSVAADNYSHSCGIAQFHDATHGDGTAVLSAETGIQSAAPCACNPSATRSVHCSAHSAFSSLPIDGRASDGHCTMPCKKRRVALERSVGCGKPLPTARDLTASNPTLASASSLSNGDDNHSDNDVNEDLTLRKSTRKRKRDTEKSDTKVSALPKKRRVQSSAVGKRGALCSVSAMAGSRRSNRNDSQVIRRTPERVSVKSSGSDLLTPAMRGFGKRGVAAFKSRSALERSVGDECDHSESGIPLFGPQSDDATHGDGTAALRAETGIESTTQRRSESSEAWSSQL